MAFLLKNASVFISNSFRTADLLIEGDRIAGVGEAIGAFEGKVFDFSGKYIFPGFVDVHVHFREPGFSYKETIKSGCAAAARSGYTAVCTMPNLSPCPDCAENLEVQLDLIRRDASIAVYPYGAITVGEGGAELSDMRSMAKNVIGFSDDGRGVQSDEMMKKAMLTAKSLSKPVVAHCEVNSLLNGGYIHDGEYARLHGHRGICSESEWRQIERDLELAAQTGVKYHVCHISARESVEIIRRAKKSGVDVTCETAPHYLLLSDSQLEEDGAFKMNPPLRSEEDRLALIEGISDGTIDMIATDHAPHSAEEKNGGLEKSLMGIVGLETSFPTLYTGLVKTGVITLERLIELMSIAPARRFSLESGIKIGAKADLCVFDLDAEYEINPDTFLSRGRATPFAGRRVFGECLMTVCGGAVVYKGKTV